MEHISSLPPDTQRYWGTSATRDKLVSTSNKVVTISSHPAWPGRHESRDGAGTECEIVADTVHLMRCFHEVLERVRQGPVLNMEDDAVTTGQMIDHVWRRLGRKNAPIRLNQLLRDARSERAVICTFLALLELVRLDAILLRQDRNFADILVRRNTALSS
jgi:segregation and condensation protein A